MENLLFLGVPILKHIRVYCLLIGIPMQNTAKETPKSRNGIIQIIRMDKSTGEKRVKKLHVLSLHVH